MVVKFTATIVFFLTVLYSTVKGNVQNLRVIVTAHWEADVIKSPDHKRLIEVHYFSGFTDSDTIDLCHSTMNAVGSECDVTGNQWRHSEWIGAHACLPSARRPVAVCRSTSKALSSPTSDRDLGLSLFRWLSDASTVEVNCSNPTDAKGEVRGHNNNAYAATWYAVYQNVDLTIRQSEFWLRWWLL